MSQRAIKEIELTFPNLYNALNLYPVWDRSPTHLFHFRTENDRSFAAYLMHNYPALSEELELSESAVLDKNGELKSLDEYDLDNVPEFKDFDTNTTVRATKQLIKTPIPLGTMAKDISNIEGKIIWISPAHVRRPLVLDLINRVDTKWLNRPFLFQVTEVNDKAMIECSSSLIGANLMVMHYTGRKKHAGSNSLFCVEEEKGKTDALRSFLKENVYQESTFVDNAYDDKQVWQTVYESWKNLSPDVEQISYMRRKTGVKLPLKKAGCCVNSNFFTHKTYNKSKVSFDEVYAVYKLCNQQIDKAAAEVDKYHRSAEANSKFICELSSQVWTAMEESSSLKQKNQLQQSGL